MDKIINKQPEQLTFDEMRQNLYTMYNQYDIVKNYVKKHDKELIKVLNADGTINENMVYGSKEYRAFIQDYIKKHDTGKIKALDIDGTVKVKKVYDSIENRVLKIMHKPLTDVHIGDANFDPMKEDGYEVKYVGELAFINPGAKSFDSLVGKITRLTRDEDDSTLSLDEAIKLKYGQKLEDLYKDISDWARFTIILPNYSTALAAVSYFAYMYGGLPKINDYAHSKKETYEAFHLNTTYKDVNLEFQFHTKENIQFKKIDDILYHSYVNVDYRSESGVEKAQLEQIEKQYAQVLFSHSDFQQNVPAMDAFIQDCKAKGAKKGLPGKYKHFCMYARKAQAVQDEIAKDMPEILKTIEKLKNTGLSLEK